MGPWSAKEFFGDPLTSSGDPFLDDPFGDDAHPIDQVRQYQPALSESSFLENLNADQREAVLTTEGPLLVLAGAGTGKTKVLTTRLACIIEQGLARTGEVLCVTFTNKAANEMRGRIEELIGYSLGGMWIGTFHALSARMLRRHAERIGVSPDFTILDNDDQIRLIKQLAGELSIDLKTWPPGVLLNRIGRWKDQALAPPDIPADIYASYTGSGLERLYPLYQSRLHELDALDFGDLLLRSVHLLRDHTDILDHYRQRFRYVLVDEYQDTNMVQYLWLRLLARPIREGDQANICCVGDEDQSIYGWRGAEIGNILRFEKDFDGARVVRLECNYRSTRHILGAASGLIAHNSSRLGKTLWTEADGGDKVQVLACYDDKAEAQAVSVDVENRRLSGVPYKECAVLVRAGFQTRSFEEQFISNQIPYRVIGGLRFYEREETRDAIAYLRLLRQPADNLAFLRIINKPTRGIGSTSLNHIQEYASQNACSLMAATQNLLEQDAFKGAAKRGLEKIIDQFAAWRADLKDGQHAGLAAQILDESGYMNLWKLSKKPDAPGRVENLNELVRAMADYADLGAFLDHVSLVMDGDENSQEDRVSLMTLHAAKGLEFDCVYLPGWEEELFPHHRAIRETENRLGGGVEEERRLAYVGLTRARRWSMILFAARRQQYGTWGNSSPSRFLYELPREHIHALSSQDLVRPSSHYGGHYGQKINMPSNTKPANATPPAPKPPEDSSFQSGARCQHALFGQGTVQECNGPHVRVLFDSGDEKLLMADFLKRL